MVIFDIISPYVSASPSLKQVIFLPIILYAYLIIEFFVACVLHGLEYIHSKGIIHRDIKPENLVFDSDGYLKVTDFGISRIWNPENAQDTSGTPGYMAPEVMCRQNHGVAADYFAVGVIAYECMLGKRPYQGKTRKEIRDQILMKQAGVKIHEIPPGWSLDSIDFINKVNDERGVVNQIIAITEEAVVQTRCERTDGCQEPSLDEDYVMARIRPKEACSAIYSKRNFSCYRSHQIEAR